MNTEAKPTVRKDALVATLAIGALGLLWIVFRLYWQGTLLLAAAVAVAYFGVLRPRKVAERDPGAAPEPAPAKARADKPRRTKKRKRRK